MFAAVCASMISISVIKENVKPGALIRESDSHILQQLCCLHVLFNHFFGSKCYSSHLQFSSEEYLSVGDSIIRLTGMLLLLYCCFSHPGPFSKGYPVSNLG